MIKTIIFDIGGVLAGFDWRTFYEGQGFGGEMIERLADATVRSEVWKEYDRGCLTDEEILQRFVANDPEIETEIRKALDDFHGLVTKYDYAIPWVKELKAEGFQILVLSNFSQKALRECWHGLDFLPYVDGGILSFQDKLIKPMPEIYHLILDRYHLTPGECVFMDDTQPNVDAARAIGIHAFRFENQRRLGRNLRNWALGPAEALIFLTLNTLLSVKNTKEIFLYDKSGKSDRRRHGRTGNDLCRGGLIAS